jgi:hypothetical protein
MPDRPRAPLRLLLAAGGNTIPAWLFSCVQELEQSGAAQIVVVLRAVPTEGRDGLSFIPRLRQFLFRAYQYLDRQLFRRSPDALAPINVGSAFPDRRVFDGASLQSAALARMFREERIDVALDPFFLLPDGCFADAPTHGVWSIRFGQSGDPKTQSAPGFWEVVEGRPSTETRLCVRSRGGDGTVSLYVSVAPTDRRSVSRSQNHVYWKISAALVRRMQMLRDDPDAFLARFKAAALFDAVHNPSLAPGNVAVLRAGAALVRRYASDKWRNTLYREQWALAYQQGAGDQLEIGAFRRLMPPADRFWADPFPVQVGNEYYIFHEEMLFSTGKGTIVLTVVNDTAAPVAQCVPILETDCHLSYPFVFAWDGDFFMIPETASRRQVELYRCVAFPARWKLERVLLSGLRAFDSTAAFLFGRWWLFANVAAYGPGTDELHLFHADSPLGPWISHRSNPIKGDVRSARPAGRIFENDGQVYRPAQDCSRHYGYAVSLNRILQLDPERYEELEVSRITPNGSPSVAGVHTFNRVGNLTVIDCLMRSRKFRTPQWSLSPSTAGPLPPSLTHDGARSPASRDAEAALHIVA